MRDVVTSVLELAAVALVVVATSVTGFWLGLPAGVLPAAALAAVSGAVACGAASWLLHGAPGVSWRRFRRGGGS